MMSTIIQLTRNENTRGCPGVPVHGGISTVFIHGVVTQFLNVSFLCVPVHEDTTEHSNLPGRGYLTLTVHSCH